MNTKNLPIKYIYLIQDPNKTIITKKHKDIGTWHWAVEKISGESGKADCYLALLGRNDRRKERRVQILPGTVCLQNV